MEYETTATTNQLDSSEVVFDWSTEGHDPSRSGYNKNSTGPKSDVDARWVYEADNSSRHEPAVVADGLVFVPTRDGLQVLNNETGVTVWNETEISVDHVSVSEGVAVTTSSFDSEIRAYDAMTGEEQWNVTNFDARNIVVSNGTIYVERYYQSQDYVRLYAFDLQTGTEQWSVQHADDVGEDSLLTKTRSTRRGSSQTGGTASMGCSLLTPRMGRRAGASRLRESSRCTPLSWTETCMSALVVRSSTMAKSTTQ